MPSCSWMSPKDRQARPVVARKAVGRRRGRRPAGAMAGRLRSARTPAARLTGTLMRKAQRQLTAETTRPPSTAPRMAPMTPRPLQSARAAFRCSLFSYTVSTIDSAAADSTAAPRPCNALPATRSSWFPARPHRTDATAKVNSPARKALRRPITSETRPPNSSRLPYSRTYALITQGRADGPAGRSAPIEGRATLTTVTSSMTISCATPTAAIGSQDTLAGRAGIRSPPGRTSVSTGASGMGVSWSGLDYIHANESIM